MIRIHIIRSETVDIELYDDVTSLLSQFPGPMKFQTDDDYARFLEDEILEKYIPTGDFFETLSLQDKKEEPVKNYVPQVWEETTWSSIFSKCREYRKKKQLNPDEMVVLLTDLRNDKNWFSASDPLGENNFFIHTSQWEYFTHADPRFPVTFLVATAILHKLMFPDYISLIENMHHDVRGCISDFCQDKREITLKLRTADICEDCITIIKQQSIPNELFVQCIRIMEHIRSQILFRERFELFQQSSRILITADKEPVHFLDMDNSQLRLSPLEKTIFILFLENPEGIPFNRVDEYRNRIREIYNHVGHKLSHANLERTLDNLTSPFENRLSEIISRMRTKFIKHLGEEIAEQYIIDGPNGEPKKINLDRNLVVWDGIEPKH